MKLDLKQVAEWIVSILVAAISGTIFVYSTFTTKTEAHATAETLQREISILREDIISRLMRIENKIDKQ